MAMKFNGVRVAAIKRSIHIAADLQSTHPEIAHKYLHGMTCEEIADDLSLSENYNTSIAVAKCAVSLALRGYDEDKRDHSFAGLLSESELSKERQNKIKIGRARGHNTQQNRQVGIYNIPKEKRTLYGRRGGEKTLREGTGIFSLSEEKRKEIRKKRSKASVKARGDMPFIERNGTKLGELEYLFDLSQNQQFQHQSGRARGLPNLSLIAESLNENYHNNEPVRSKRTVASTLYKIRRGITTI
jgi:hypothetical protein